MNDWSIKQEAKLWGYHIWAWVTWDNYWFAKAEGLTELKIHIQTERAKMTRKLWLKIMFRDNWQCQIRYAGCRGRAEEVDHIKALYNWGYTNEWNLQAA